MYYLCFVNYLCFNYVLIICVSVLLTWTKLCASHDPHSSAPSELAAGSPSRSAASERWSGCGGKISFPQILPLLLICRSRLGHGPCRRPDPAVRRESPISRSIGWHYLPTVIFHNFKSKDFKLSVSNPKSKYVAYLSVLSQISNCQSLGRKNKHEILTTDRNATCLIRPRLFHVFLSRQGAP